MTDEETNGEAAAHFINSLLRVTQTAPRRFIDLGPKPPADGF